MIRHCVVEVKVIDVDHVVLGAWGRYNAVPMQFIGCEVGCWGGQWSTKCEFVSFHCELHYVHIFLLGPNVADDASICDLSVLGDFVPADGKSIVSYLYVP